MWRVVAFLGVVAFITLARGSDRIECDLMLNTWRCIYYLPVSESITKKHHSVAEMEMLAEICAKGRNIEGSILKGRPFVPFSMGELRLVAGRYPGGTQRGVSLLVAQKLTDGSFVGVSSTFVRNKSSSVIEANLEKSNNCLVYIFDSISDRFSYSCADWYNFDAPATVPIHTPCEAVIAPQALDTRLHVMAAGAPSTPAFSNFKVERYFSFATDVPGKPLNDIPKIGGGSCVSHVKHSGTELMVEISNEACVQALKGVGVAPDQNGVVKKGFPVKDIGACQPADLRYISLKSMKLFWVILCRDDGSKETELLSGVGQETSEDEEDSESDAKSVWKSIEIWQYAVIGVLGFLLIGLLLIAFPVYLTVACRSRSEASSRSGTDEGEDSQNRPPDGTTPSQSYAGPESGTPASRTPASQAGSESAVSGAR